MRTDIVIAYHIGAPQTDNGQLFRSLRKDPDLMNSNGVLIRRPKEYLQLINNAIKQNIQRESTHEEQEQLLSTLTNQQAVGRLLLTNSSFLGVPAWMFHQASFYQNAGVRTNELRNLFPANPCEFYLAIKNPATFIPEAFQDQDAKDYQEFIGAIDLKAIRWSDVIERIQQANPDCPITVWCNEDTPIIWSTVLAEVSAVDLSTVFAGDLDIISGIISSDGRDRLDQYLSERSKLNGMQRRRVKAVFLEKFVLDDAVNIEIDLPDWTEELVEELTDIYDDDIERIARLPGVNLITP